jgi:hypothetical protein
VKVEFAEADAGASVRPVKTKATGAIHDELAKLRTVATGKAPVAVATTAAPAPKKAGSLDQRLQDILGTPAKPKGTGAEGRKKTTVQVPAKLLKEAASVKVQITFEGPGLGTAAPETVTIALGARTSDAVDLHLELKPKS